MLEIFDDQIPDRSGLALENCGARWILSFFGLNITEIISRLIIRQTYVGLNKAGCSLNICANCSVSKRKSFFVTSFL